MVVAAAAAAGAAAARRDVVVVVPPPLCAHLTAAPLRLMRRLVRRPRDAEAAAAAADEAGLAAMKAADIARVVRSDAVRGSRWRGKRRPLCAEIEPGGALFNCPVGRTVARTFRRAERYYLECGVSPCPTFTRANRDTREGRPAPGVGLGRDGVPRRRRRRRERRGRHVRGAAWVPAAGRLHALGEAASIHNCNLELCSSHPLGLLCVVL